MKEEVSNVNSADISKSSDSGSVISTDGIQKMQKPYETNAKAYGDNSKEVSSL